MEPPNEVYLTKIKEDLSKKQRSNPQYSMRAYAKHLGLHSATLSKVLKGQRALPVRSIKTVAAKLSMSPKEYTLFIESFYKTKTKLDDIKVPNEDDSRFILDESYHKVIAEWEHYAVLTLFDVSEIDLNAKEFSTRLGISITRSEVVIENLLNCGLLKKESDGSLAKAFARVRTTEDIQSNALKQAHIESLEMGKIKLEEVEMEMRDFSSMTIAMDLKKLPEAKTVIREFRQKLSALLRDGEKTEVFQLAIQFYPMTELKKQ